MISFDEISTVLYQWIFFLLGKGHMKKLPQEYHSTCKCEDKIL